MKSTFRSIILVALIAFLAVVPGFNAHAQDNCFGLKLMTVPWLMARAVPQTWRNLRRSSWITRSLPS